MILIHHVLLQIALHAALCKRITPRPRLAAAALLQKDPIKSSNFNKRWRITSEIPSTVPETLKKKLNLLLKGGGGELCKEIDATVKEVQAKILPSTFEIFFNSNKIAELTANPSFMSMFKAQENRAIYSVWQYRSNVFGGGGTLTLEIHFKIPLATKHGTTDFTPIVVYTCGVAPGRIVHGTATFTRGDIKLLLHPLYPWRWLNAGEFAIAPAHLSTAFIS